MEVCPDKCLCWLLARKAHTNSHAQGSGRTIYRRVTEILTTSEAETDLTIAVIDVFSLKAARHPVFGMPILARSSGKPSHIIVPVKVGC